MPRRAQGTTFVSDGAVYASVTVAPGKRAARALAFLSVEDAHAAKAWAATLQELVDALRASGRSSEIDDKLTLSVQVGADDPEGGLQRVRAGVAKLRAGTKGERIATVGASSKKTFKKFAEHWTSGKLHAEYPDHVADKKTADDDVSRLVKYIYPIIGPLLLADVTLKHAQDVLRRIPAKASRSTRRHVAQLMVRVFNLAVYPSEVLERSPLPRGFLPKVGPRKAGAYLYPDEDRALLACVETEDGGGGVPLVYRVLYGFLAREGMRSASEALSLTWADLDLERGAIRLDTNKTDDPRAWTLDPGVVAALTKWHELRGKPAKTARVFSEIEDSGHLARKFRELHLPAAGIKRPELFENTKARKHITAHNLRATFVTIALANGRTSDWVADRTGHKSTGQIATYKRAARMVEELELGPLEPLNEAIPELRSARIVQGKPSGGRRQGTPRRANRSAKTREVHGRGLEPLRLAAAEPKSAAYANFATRACVSNHLYLARDDHGGADTVVAPREAPGEERSFRKPRRERDEEAHFEAVLLRIEGDDDRVAKIEISPDLGKEALVDGLLRGEHDREHGRRTPLRGAHERSDLLARGDLREDQVRDIVCQHGLRVETERARIGSVRDRRGGEAARMRDRADHAGGPARLALRTGENRGVRLFAAGSAECFARAVPSGAVFHLTLTNRARDGLG